ncbi:MAG: sigma-70 family RNA polymerase sigma factor [Thermoanaerobaculia bacterium]
MDEILEKDVALALAGDESAFVRLIEQTGAVVCSIALAIVRNVHASEDVAQEVYLAAWNDRRNLRNPASFLPWLRQITRNQARLWLRRHRRELQVEPAALAAVDARPTPEAALLTAEEERVLRDVLDSLPEEVREIVTLYYREGSSSQQVADLLGLSEPAVRQRLSRARARVRDEVLTRFGDLAVRSAPRAGFAGLVAMSMMAAAPPAAAAAVAVTGKSASVISLAALAGSLIGVLGVVMGIRRLRPWFDERERLELYRFGTHAAAAVMLLGLVLTWLAASPPPRYNAVPALVLFFAAVYYLYRVRLPRILQRRWEWECAVNPEVAAEERQRWLTALASNALGATLGGVGIMTVVIRWLR